MNAELKWTKVSNAKLTEYRKVLDFHFNWLVPRGACYHALIVDCSALNHRRFNQGDPDLGFNKFVFQLLNHRVGRVYCEHERVVVDMDARNSTRDVNELQRVLNSAMGRYYDDATKAPFARLVYRDSRSTRLLQVADLLTGAVAWHKNDHDSKPGSSGAKSALANYAAQCVDLRRLGGCTRKSEDRLGVWNLRMQR